MAEHRMLFPTGLTRRLSRRLTEYTHTADGKSPADLLCQAENHVEAVRVAHRRNAMINIRLAEALCGVIRSVVADWDTLPPHSQSWLRAAIYYFAYCDDDQPDFASPIGFEDDTEVLNACLRLAERDNLVLKPEDYDDV
jgi:uncharacterized membrane protein YkvA (DUF1232 family)